MELGDKLQGLLKSQKKILKEYETLFEEINLNDPINENIRVKKEMEALKQELEDAEERIADLKQENINIRASLRDQMLNERSAILNGSKQSIKIYFDDIENQEVNKLQSLEYSLKNRINRIKAIASRAFE